MKRLLHSTVSTSECTFLLLFAIFDCSLDDLGLALNALG
jgi:hypothetical protein